MVAVLKANQLAPRAAFTGSSTHTVKAIEADVRLIPRANSARRRLRVCVIFVTILCISDLGLKGGTN